MTIKEDNDAAVLVGESEQLIAQQNFFAANGKFKYVEPTELGDGIGTWQVDEYVFMNDGVQEAGGLMIQKCQEIDGTKWVKQTDYGNGGFSLPWTEVTEELPV